jgi:hypothetical protein
MTDAPKPKRPSSAVTSGRKLFVDGDPNSAWSRRYRDLIAGHISDLGGADLLSDAQISLCRKAATIECQLELWEGAFSRGEEPVHFDVYTRSASHLRRILESLGLKRVPRDVRDPLEAIAAEYWSHPTNAEPSEDDLDRE